MKISKKLYYIGDTVLSHLHLEYPQWQNVFDIDPVSSNASKVKLFNQIADEHALVAAQHFNPFPGLGYVEKKENGWKWIPECF